MCSPLRPKGKSHFFYSFNHLKQLHNFNIIGISIPLGTLINLVEIPIYETCVDSLSSLQALPLPSCRHLNSNAVQSCYKTLAPHVVWRMYWNSEAGREESRKLFMWQEKECEPAWIKGICKMGDVLDLLYSSLYYMTANLVQKDYGILFIRMSGVKNWSHQQISSWFFWRGNGSWVLFHLWNKGIRLFFFLRCTYPF